MNRDVLIRLLVTPAEREAWQAAADKAGLKLSEWIRRRVQGETTIAVPPAPHIKSTSILGTDIEDELVARAIKTFVAGGGSQPSGTSDVEEIDGQPYVVLRNAKGALAYYQIIGGGGSGKHRLKHDESMSRKKGGK